MSHHLQLVYIPLGLPVLSSSVAIKSFFFSGKEKARFQLTWSLLVTLRGSCKLTVLPSLDEVKNSSVNLSQELAAVLCALTLFSVFSPLMKKLAQPLPVSLHSCFALQGLSAAKQGKTLVLI